MKKFLFLPLFLLLCAFLRAEPTLLHSETAVPGGIGYVRVEGDSGTTGAHAEIVTLSGKTVAEAESFSFLPSGRLDSVWVCLLGISPTLDPGEYSIRATLDHIEGRKIYNFSINVGWKQFKSEEIPLRTDLTELRSKPDPRKAEEARILRKLVKGFSPSAVFALEHHRIPVDEFRISSFFGDRRTYLYSNGERAYAIHNGIDFAAPKGTPVYASASGRVIFTGEWVIAGKTIIIEHLPGVFGLYYHLDSIAVDTGEYVKKGRAVGTIGSTGLATGDHLHWEIRVGGVPVDPNIFVSEDIIDKAVIFGNSKPTKIEQRG